MNFSLKYIIEAPKDVISWVIHLMRLFKNWVTFLIYGAVQQYILAAAFCSSIKQPHNILIKWNGFTAILAAEADLNHHDVRSSQGTPSFLVDFGVHHFFLWFYTSLHLNSQVYLYNLRSSVTGKYETDVSVSLSRWVFLINGSHAHYYIFRLGFLVFFCCYYRLLRTKRNAQSISHFQNACHLTLFPQDQSLKIPKG